MNHQKKKGILNEKTSSITLFLDALLRVNKELISQSSFGILLIIFCFLQLISTNILPDQVIPEDHPIDYLVFGIIKYCNVLSIMTFFTISQTVQFYMMFTLNVYIIVTILICSYLTNYTSNEFLFRINFRYLGILQQSYNWVIFMPNLNLYLHYMIVESSDIPKLAISSIMIIFPIMYAMSIRVSLSLDIRYIKENPLGKKVTRTDDLMIFFQTVCVVFSKLNESSNIGGYMGLVNIICGVLLLIVYLMEIKFYNDDISRIFATSIAAWIIFSFVCLFRLQFNQESYLVPSAIIILIIIDYLLWRIYKNLLYYYIFESQSLKENQVFLDYVLKKIFLMLKQYQEGSKEHQFYLIAYIENHLNTCIYSICFCKNLLTNSGDIYKLVSSASGNEDHSDANTVIANNINRIILNLIQHQYYLKIHESHRKKDFYFQTAFMSFLSFHMHNPILAYTVLMSLKEDYSNFKPKEKYIINLYDHELSNMINAKLNSKMLGEKQFGNAIEFNEKFTVQRAHVITILKMYIEFFIALSENVLDLDRIEKEATKLMQKKAIVEENFAFLLDINPSSQLLYDLFMKYQFLNVGTAKKNMSFIQKMMEDRIRFKLNENFDHDRDSLHNIEKLNIFDERNGIIFISLNEKKQEKIFSFTPRIAAIFGHNEQDLPFLQLSSLMPRMFAEKHHMFVKLFIERSGGLKNTTCEYFGLEKRGFIFKLKMVMKLESLQGQLCVAALMRRINRTHYYILADKMGNIQNYSYNLKEKLRMGNDDSWFQGFNIALLIPNLFKDLVALKNPLPRRLNRFLKKFWNLKLSQHQDHNSTLLTSNKNSSNSDESREIEDEKKGLQFLIVPKHEARIEDIKKIKSKWSGFTSNTQKSQLVFEDNKIFAEYDRNLIICLCQLHRNSTIDNCRIYRAQVKVTDDTYPLPQNQVVSSKSVEFISIKEILSDKGKKKIMDTLRETLDACTEYLKKGYRSRQAIEEEEEEEGEEVKAEATEEHKKTELNAQQSTDLITSNASLQMEIVNNRNKAPLGGKQEVNSSLKRIENKNVTMKSLMPAAPENPLNSERKKVNFDLKETDELKIDNSSSESDIMVGGSHRSRIPDEGLKGEIKTVLGLKANEVLLQRLGNKDGYPKNLNRTGPVLDPVKVQEILYSSPRNESIDARSSEDQHRLIKSDRKNSVTRMISLRLKGGTFVRKIVSQVKSDDEDLLGSSNNDESENDKEFNANIESQCLSSNVLKKKRTLGIREFLNPSKMKPQKKRDLSLEYGEESTQNQSQSSKSSHRIADIRKMISEEVRPKYFLQLNILGYFGLLVLMTLISLLFALVYSQIQEYRVYIRVADFTCAMTSSLSIYMKELEKIMFLNNGLFTSPSIMNYTYVESTSEYMFNLSYYFYKVKYVDEVELVNLEAVSRNFKYSNFTCIISEKNEELFPNGTYGVDTYEISFEEAMVRLMRYMSDVMTIPIQNFNPNDEYVMYIRGNYVEYFYLLTVVTHELFQDLYGTNRTIDMNSFAQTQMIVCLIVNFFLVLMLYPIHRNAETIRIKALSLFRTFTQNDIEKRIEYFEGVLSRVSKGQMEKQADLLVRTKNNIRLAKSSRSTQQGSRVTRSWTKERTNIFLFFSVILFVFGVTGAYFIAATLRLQYHSANLLPMIAEYDMVTDQYSFVPVYYCLTYNLMNQYGQDPQYIADLQANYSYAMFRVIGRMDDMNQHFDQLDSFLDTNGDTSATYKSQLMSLRNQNVCNFLTLNASEYAECASAIQGVMSLGLTVAETKIYSILQSWVDYLGNNSYTVENTMYLINNQQFVEVDLLLRYLDATMRTYVEDEYVNLEYMMDNQDTEAVAMFCLGIFMIVICLFVGWRPFMKKNERDFMKTKSFFSLIPTDLILSNSYVRKFLKENSKLMRK